jgi:Replication-relaxation
MTDLELQRITTKVKHRRGWRTTSRDLDILVAIYRFRFLTRQLIEWTFFSNEDSDFDGRSSLAARRLQALHQAAYVQRLVLPMLPGTGRSPLVYALNSRGADAVASRLGIDRDDVDWQPRHNRATAFFMEHTLAIARLWAALASGLRGSEVTMKRWIGEGELRRRQTRVYDYHGGRWLPVRPDGYFELGWPDGRSKCFFVEVDMGTETNSRFARKMRAYDRYQRDGYDRDFGLPWFNVVVVTSGAKRLDNLRRAVRQSNTQIYCYFATLSTLHPSRILTGWEDRDGDTVDLIEV